MASELVRNLINGGVHFGHGVSRWNPKMEPYIYAKRGRIHIIDVKKTLEGMIIAKKLLAETTSSGKDVIFVGTKRQAQKIVQQAAEKCGMHYVSHRWLGGTLTNFRTIRARLQRLEELEAMAEDGTLDQESKKQASRLKRELRKIKGNLEGVRNMSRLPGVVVVVDVQREYLALREARKLGIATVGIIDTNSDPDNVDVAIPANDDSIKAIEIILNELADAVAVGKTMVRTEETAPRKARRGRSSRSALARADESEPAQAASPGAPTPTPVVEPVTTEQPAAAEAPVEQRQAEQAAAVENEEKTAADAERNGKTQPAEDAKESS